MKTKKALKVRPTHYTEAEFRKLLDYAKTLPDAWRDYDLGEFNEATAADFIATTNCKVFWDATPDAELAELLESEPELRKHREAKIAEYQHYIGPTHATLGRMAFEAFCKKDAQFFRNIALWIECNQADGPRVTNPDAAKSGHQAPKIKPITPKELGIKKGKGQRGKRWTIDVVFPLSIWELIDSRRAAETLYRKKDVMKVDRDAEVHREQISRHLGDYMRRRITRDELRDRVNGNRKILKLSKEKRERREMDGVAGEYGEITEQELSRKITKWRFREFLA